MIEYIVMDFFILWLFSLMAIEQKDKKFFQVGIMVMIFSNLLVYFINLGFCY